MLPRTPLEQQATFDDSDIIDAEFVEVGKPIETKGCKTKSFLSNMASNGVSIADLFDTSNSLADQLGVVDQLAKLKVDCMVCAKPRKTIEVIEEALFLEQLPYGEVAARFDLTSLDIEHHVKECVLNRQAAVPVGSLVNSYVNELQEFVARMERFRLELDSDMSSESIHTYLSVLARLECSINNVLKMSSPDDEALQITKRVLNPLAVQLARDVTISFTALLDFSRSSGCIVNGRFDDFKTRLTTEIGSLLKGSFSNKFHNSILKLSELKGVDPQVILGNHAPAKMED